MIPRLSHEEWVRVLGREPTPEDRERRDRIAASLEALFAMVKERGPMTWEEIAEAEVAPALIDVVGPIVRPGDN